MTNAILKDFARNMIDKGATDQFIDTAILSRYQKSHGLTECKKALAAARLESMAQDLFEVVEAMADFDGRNNNQALKDMARAAINKARGNE